VGTPEDNSAFRTALAEVVALDGMMVPAAEDDGGLDGGTP
jgi:hypothetical protein